jgi:GH25 family lysozyme M1 (1,4-beta-N-acetylmuramidase)
MNRLSEYVIWLAEYRDVPKYTGYYQIWQYTSKGQIDGIEGYVDLNLSYMD